MAAEEFNGDSLRQRLVGGIALLVIGVIAWFWLLSGDSPVDPVSRATQIPAAPDIRPFDVPEPKPPADIAPVGGERDSTPALQADIAADKPAPVAPAGANPPKSVTAPKAVAEQSAAAEKNVTASAKISVDEKASPSGKIATVPAKNQTATATPSAKSKEAFQLDQHGLPVAWVVQVGLFSTQASADKIKAELQEKGFKAYTEPYKTANAPAGVKVFVGPKLSRERADEQKRAIDAALKINSMVMRFQAPEH